MYAEYQAYEKLGVTDASGKVLAPTPTDIEGPFYKVGAPFKTSLLDPDDTPNLHLNGRVYNTSGETLAGATLDFWQADASGTYDMVGFKFRGKVKTDANGSFSMATIVPGFYEIGPNEYRCAHVHAKVSADGYKLLTTQLYFEDDKYDATDGWFNPQMVIGVPDGVFNFVLDKE